MGIRLVNSTNSGTNKACLIRSRQDLVHQFLSIFVTLVVIYANEVLWMRWGFWITAGEWTNNIVVSETLMPSVGLLREKKATLDLSSDHRSAT